MGNAAGRGREQSSTRVFACSDLHVDHKSNWTHLQAVVREGGFTGRDVLIVAGDVSSDLGLLRRTLSFLADIFHGGDDEDAKSGDRVKKKMSNVFFCPGNNELRLVRGDKKNNTQHSLDKLAEVIRVCDEVGVHTRPSKINGQVWIVPLLAWYTPRFDEEWDHEHDYRRGWLDFRACEWPEGLDDTLGGVSAHFLDINEQWMSSPLVPFDAPVVSFSHFLPRFELLGRRIFLHNKTLPLVVGDARLDEQIRRVGSAVHVFGHTHIDKDVVVDGVRYVQHAFGHPKERKQLWAALKSAYKPKLVLEISPDGYDVGPREELASPREEAHAKKLEHDTSREEAEARGPE